MIDVGATEATARVWLREQRRAELALRARLAEAEAARAHEEHDEREWQRAIALVRCGGGRGESR